MGDEIKWNDPRYRCYGCTYNARSYAPECEGCRRRANTEYNTSTEDTRYIGLPDKYIPEVSYGTRKVLVKK